MENPQTFENDKIRQTPGDVQNNEDRDVAMALVGERRQEFDPAVEVRVVRKIDLFLVPAMVFGYGMVYYDKVSEILFQRTYSNNINRQF